MSVRHGRFPLLDPLPHTGEGDAASLRDIHGNELGVTLGQQIFPLYAATNPEYGRALATNRQPTNAGMDIADGPPHLAAAIE